MEELVVSVHDEWCFQAHVYTCVCVSFGGKKKKMKGNKGR